MVSQPYIRLLLWQAGLMFPRNFIFLNGLQCVPVESRFIMARKRSKRLTTNSPQKQVRADWKHEDEVETLAWLDYNLSTNKDARAFKSSVVDHLGKTRLAKYTIGQIERKVRKFWNDTGSDDSTDRDEIYRLGTACLEHLPLNFKEEIYKRVSTLTDQALAETLSSQRQLRSASRTTDSELARHICPGVVVANILSPRKRQREVLSSSAAKDNSSPGKRKRQAAQVCGARLFKRQQKSCGFADQLNRAPLTPRDKRCQNKRIEMMHCSSHSYD